MDRRRRSPEEIKQSMEIAKKMMERSKKKELEKDLKWARGVIIVMSIITLLYGISTAMGPFGRIYIPGAADIVIGLTVFGLYFYSKEKPYEAILATLIIYGASWIIMAAIEPISIFRGILFKIVIVGGLITGLRASLKIRNRPAPNDELLDDIE